MKTDNKKSADVIKGKRIKLFLFVVALIAFSATTASANHNVCTIKAGDRIVWVRVFDVDPDGNIMHGYRSGYYSRNILWRGMLKEGEVQEIRSSNGEIKYEYQASSEDRGYGGNFASCSHGETIVVP
jgi:hypothetical protein